MAARAIWKGVLKIGTDKMPVKLYSAVQDQTVHFHILDSAHHERVKQRMVEPQNDTEVPRDEIQRGLETEPGVFVVFKNEELDKLEPEASRDIEITRFVEPERINHQWYERPYYLGPDDNDETAYFALAKAMDSAGREGVARWVMRKKRYAGALRSKQGYLVLVTLRHSEEVLSAKELPAPAGRPLSEKELDMGQQLVNALQDKFRPEDFHDEYRERVMKFIEAKAKGQAPKLKTIARKGAAPSLADALSASLAHAKRAGGKAVA
jgi:DNA end-binding protein Ku